MKSFRSKPVGWRGESQRHYLAAKGIKTKHKYYAYAPTYTGADLGPIAVDAMGTTGAAVVPWIPVAVPLLMLYGGVKYVKKKKDKTGSYFADQDMMSFSPADLQAFDAEMKVAREQGDDQFTFKGKPVLVSYGAYLSEYLHGKFDQQHFAKKEDLDALDRAGLLKSREEVDREVEREDVDEERAMEMEEWGSIVDEERAMTEFNEVPHEIHSGVMRVNAYGERPIFNDKYYKHLEKLEEGKK